MDNTAEETFEGLTTEEFVKSAIIGIAATIVVIGAVKLVKRVRKVMKADDALWAEEPTIEPLEK